MYIVLEQIARSKVIVVYRIQTLFASYIPIYFDQLILVVKILISNLFGTQINDWIYEFTLVQLDSSLRYAFYNAHLTAERDTKINLY